jgi:hypothetical protein
MSFLLCVVQLWEKTIPLNVLLIMPEWSWPEFMSDRSVVFNQTKKTKLRGGFKQSCSINTNTTALVICYPLLIQRENPMKHHNSSYLYSFVRCSFETKTIPLYVLLTMPEWSLQEFMSDRSMTSNQATKTKLCGGFKHHATLTPTQLHK